MHYSLLIILVVLNHVLALTSNDRMLITDIREIIRDEESKSIRDAMNLYRTLFQAIIDARQLDESKLRALQRLLTRLDIDYSDASPEELDNFEKNFVLIIDEGRKLSEEQVHARLNQVSLGAFETTRYNLRVRLDNYYKSLVALISSKIRQLSISAQQSETGFIDAFNTFAYAGFITRDDSYEKFLEILEKY